MTETRLEPGQKAPAFKLLDQDGHEFDVASLHGKKVVVYFYPAAATPGCTTQACDFRDNLNVLKALGYEVVGISPDKPEKLKKFIEKEGLNFSLLSDPDNEVQKGYGAHGIKKMYGKEYEGTIRSTFALDEAGLISHAFYNVKAKGHFEYLRKHMSL